MQKNKKLLDDFIDFCKKNPELRFWQALTVWSGATKIFYEKKFHVGDGYGDDFDLLDTFNWENRND